MEKILGHHSAQRLFENTRAFSEKNNNESTH